MKDLVFLSLILALLFVCPSDGQETLQEWEWQRATIQGQNQYHYFYYYSDVVPFKFNVTVWPCFGASDLFLKNGGVPSSSDSDASNTYDGSKLASYFAWRQYGAAFGPNATAAVRSVKTYPNTGDSAEFDLVYNNDSSDSDSNGFNDRVPKPWDIDLDIDSDNDKIHLTYKKAATGLGTDEYHYYRFNGSFDSLKSGWVYSTACGVRRFMTEVTPDEEVEVNSNTVKATFSVPFEDGFDGYHNFVVLVDRVGCPTGVQCYSGVYPLVRVSDSAATLAMAVSALLLFFCVLFALF